MKKIFLLLMLFCMEKNIFSDFDNLSQIAQYQSRETPRDGVDDLMHSFLHNNVSTLRKFSRLKISSKVSIKNVCLVSGRSGSTLTKFRLSRISFRTLALSGKLPGVRKAS